MAADALGAAGVVGVGVVAEAGVGGLVAGVAGGVQLLLMAAAVMRAAWTLRTRLMAWVLAMEQQQLQLMGLWPMGSTLDTCLGSSGSSDSSKQAAQLCAACAMWLSPETLHIPATLQQCRLPQIFVA